MRLLILSLMILMLPIEMSAEKDYSVFLIKGKIELRNGKNVSRLKEKQQLSENDTIAVKEGSCLVLRSVSEKRHTITIKTSFYGPIKRISDGKTSGATKKSRSKEFMDYTFKRSASDFKKDGSYMSGMGTTLRDVIPSLSTNTMMEAPDSIRQDLSELLILK